MNTNQTTIRRTLAAAGICVAGAMLTACQAATSTATTSVSSTPTPLTAATTTPAAVAPTTPNTMAEAPTTSPTTVKTAVPVISKTIKPVTVQTTKAQQVPVLGTQWGNPSQEGYGKVEPYTISNGGDPTGTVSNVSWSSWGNSTATATGTSDYVAPNQSVAQGTETTATVVAFDLGVCDGKLMYQKIEWYFANHGQQFNSNSYINICTGDYVNM
jgi:hypothetical protein